MGLMLRYYLFHNVTGKDVCGALKAFYAGRGRPLEADGPEHDAITVHEAENDWVVVDLDIGWEWKERREAQLFVSHRLWCAGFLVFVYDGDYWGYEFFDRGETLDHFVQYEDIAEQWFPGTDCRGNAEILSRHLPFLDISVIAPYLQQEPNFPDLSESKVHPQDEFGRLDECAVIDFLRKFGISIGLRPDVDGLWTHVALESPVCCTLWKLED
jgi:hypothetical protein